MTDSPDRQLISCFCVYQAAADRLASALNRRLISMKHKFTDEEVRLFREYNEASSALATAKATADGGVEL